MEQPTPKPPTVQRFEALEAQLAAVYDAQPHDHGTSFNTWLCDAADQTSHPHHAAALEYCDLWQRCIVWYRPA